MKYDIACPLKVVNRYDVVDIPLNLSIGIFSLNRMVNQKYEPPKNQVEPELV